MTNDYPAISISDFSNEAILQICEAANAISCECPGYLARCLLQVRSFKEYTKACIDKFPDNAETHHWLVAQANQIEAQIWQTTVELMRREELIDEAGYILLNKLSERAVTIALQQVNDL